MTRNILISFLMLALISCGRQEAERPDPGEGIEFPIETKAPFGEPEAKIPSKILIAGATDYAHMAANGLQSPLFEGNITDIRHWSGNSYNSKVSYPNDNSNVYILGYAPSDGLTTSDNWINIVPTYDAVYDNSLWEDILVSHPVAIGNKKAPVSTPISYRHSVARFTFLAYKDESMTDFHVKEVTLTAGAAITPYKLSWDDVNGTWKAAGDGHSTIEVQFRDKELSQDILGRGQENAIEMFPYYLVPQNGNTIGPFSIVATYYIENPVYSEKQYAKDDLYFQVGAPGNPIQAGYDYTLAIRFNQDSFTLYGICMDEWKDGGNIIIPMINETLE